MTLLSILPRERAAYERREELQELFARRYSELLGWASQLTAGDRAAAEDLVHDAYVDFARALPDLGTISNLNGYLYNALRNLNHSRIRRAWKQRHEDLDALEYDSLHSRLRWSASPDTVELQEYILRLCLYLCRRKETAHSASVLLLRFFRNYYPEEIAQLTRLSRNAVNVQILRARNEAREFLEQPSTFDSNQELEGELSAITPRGAVESDIFLRRLSMIIRSSRRGPCFSLEQLQRIFNPELPTPPDTAQLAHLVSCDECFRANPALKDDSPKGGAPFGSIEGRRRSPKKVLADAEETIQELQDHQPSAFLLAVNGLDVLECRVTAEAMDQVAVLSAGTRPEFVEVFNQTGRRLLKLDVLETPPDGPAEVVCQVPLAGCRTLEVAVEWKGPDPRLHLRYSANVADDAPASVTSEGHGIERPAGANIADPSSGQFAPWVSRLWQRFRSYIALLVPALAFALFVIGWTYYGKHKIVPQPLQAAAILQQAIAREHALAQSPGVSHRTIDVERRSADGRFEKLGHVEVWSDQSRLATRFYDPQGRLVAGEWQNGKQRPKHLEKGHILEGAASCAMPGRAWSCDLSAQSLEEMAGQSATWSVAETSGQYLLRTENPGSEAGTSSNPRLVRATLQLDRPSLRTREADIWIREQHETREYRYVEVSYERVPKAKEDDSVFSPDRGTRLLPRHPRLPLDADGDRRLAHLQLEALSILDALGNDSDQPIEVERTRDGKLLISGVVPSGAEARRTRLMFSPIASDPLIKLRIFSIRELRNLRQQEPSGPLRLNSYDIQAAARPADELLRAHFRSLGYQGDDLDRQVEQFCNRVLDQSARVLRLAWQMDDFDRNFTAREVSNLSDQDKRLWLTLLSRHAESVSVQTEVLRNEIAWMLPATVADQKGSEEPLPPVEMAEQTLQSATKLNRALRQQLMANADPNDRILGSTQAILSALLDLESSLHTIRALAEQYGAIHKPPQPNR